jgi:hypothetical protein
MGNLRRPIRGIARIRGSALAVHLAHPTVSDADGAAVCGAVAAPAAYHLAMLEHDPDSPPDRIKERPIAPLAERRARRFALRHFSEHFARVEVLATLARRCHITGELTLTDVVIDRHHVPIVLISQHGVFAFHPVGKLVESGDDLRALQTSIDRLEIALCGLGGVHGAMVRTGAQADATPTFFQASAGAAGYSCGMEQLDTFIELFSDGPDQWTVRYLATGYPPGPAPRP